MWQYLKWFWDSKPLILLNIIKNINVHKININLHNLKTALIFSIEFRETIRLDMVYVCAKLHNFLPLRGRDPRGWNPPPPPPPPPGCEMGSKDPAFLGLKLLKDKENNKKICHIFHHNFKNILCCVMSEVSLKMFYFVYRFLNSNSSYIEVEMFVRSDSQK